MHVLRVQLRRIEPPIWRDLLIPSDVTLDWLHVAIQMAMPWMDVHLHVFEIGKGRVSNPEFEVSSGPEGDEGMFTVGDVLPHVGSRITYLYDLGDDWEHGVEVREIREGERRGFLCLGGERAAPPEDCGGPPGYERLLLALAHPNHLDHAELTSWLAQGRAGDPIVNIGPDSMAGHGIPSREIALAPGHVLHIDLGVRRDSYCSDIQRCWYLPEPGETDVPDEVSRALDAVNAAITAGAQALRPGVEGWQVDAAGRAAIQAQGYPEYRHALGHQVGRLAHDGGGILGPHWERYGQTPFLAVQEGQIYTLELGVHVERRGVVGIEEMVRVTQDGCDWLTGRQTKMRVLER